MGLFRQPRKERLNASELQLSLKLTSLLVFTSKQLIQIVDKLKEEDAENDENGWKRRNQRIQEINP
jgi:hypothetical protein